MKRAIFHVVCLLSLLLCIASLLLWFRSYRTADYLAYCRENREAGVICSLGRIIFYSESVIPPFLWDRPSEFQHAARPAPASIAEYAMSNSSRHASFLGFGIISGDNGHYRASAWFVPHWFVAALAAIGPMVWIRKRYSTRADCGFEPAVSKQQ